MVVITLPITSFVSVSMVPRAVDTALAEFSQLVLELVSTSSFVFFIFDQMEGIVLSVLFFIPAIAVLTAALAIPKPVLDFEDTDWVAVATAEETLPIAVFAFSDIPLKEFFEVVSIVITASGKSFPSFSFSSSNGTPAFFNDV